MTITRPAGAGETVVGRHSRARYRLTLNPPKLFPVTLARLWPDELHELSRFALPIERDWGDELISYCHRHRSFGLPHALVALESLFGPCRRNARAEKTSFSFPLLLSTERNPSHPAYLLTVEDCRGSIVLPLHRIQDEAVRGWAYQPPFAEELSRVEINYLNGFLLDYLEGHVKNAARAAEPFFRVVGDDCIVYGKRNGELFEQSFSDRDEYSRFVDRLEEELGKQMARRSHDRVQTLVAEALAD